jgi:hypothetical protein
LLDAVTDKAEVEQLVPYGKYIKSNKTVFIFPLLLGMFLQMASYVQAVQHELENLGDWVPPIQLIGICTAEATCKTGTEKRFLQKLPSSGSDNKYIMLCPKVKF